MWRRGSGPAAFHLGALSFYFLAAGFPFFPPGCACNARARNVFPDTGVYGQVGAAEPD